MEQSSASGCTEKPGSRGTETNCVPEDMVEYSMASEAEAAATGASLFTTTQKPKAVTNHAEKTRETTTVTFSEVASIKAQSLTTTTPRPRQPSRPPMKKQRVFQGMRYKLQSILRQKPDFDKSTFQKLPPRPSQALPTPHSE